MGQTVPGPTTPCHDINSGLFSIATRPSIIVGQPPKSTSRNTMAAILANRNSRNIRVSVRMTPREPEYIVNVV